jgi:CRISPR-associated protein Cas2
VDQLFYIVAYDIPDDRRRTKVAKILEDYGDRVQYSIFELLLDSPQRLASLRRRLYRVIDSEADSVRIYFLCARCRPSIEVIGLGTPTEDPHAYVV